MNSSLDMCNEYCTFCLGNESLDKTTIGRMEFMHHAKCLHRFKFTANIVYILIIVGGLLSYVSLELPNYYATLIYFGISYLLSSSLTYVICTTGDTYAYYMGGAIPTVINHTILLGTSLVSHYDSSIISPALVTYIFMGFAWSMVAYIIVMGIIGLGLFIPVVFVRNICGLVRYSKYGKNVHICSISDDTNNVLNESFLPTTRNSKESVMSVNGSMNGRESDFLNGNGRNIRRFPDDASTFG